MRYLQGTATEAEAAALMAYVQGGDGARSQFALWQAEWEAQCLEQPDTMPGTATDQAWAQVQSRIHSAPQARPSTRVVALRWWHKAAAVAAALLLVVCGATWLAQSHTADAGVMTAYEAQPGTRRHLVLPDGSEVWLNGGSTLSFDRAFNNDHRQVSLTGEAYFEVRKHQGKPFTVHTDGYDVTVKGTRFNVQAYAADATSTTTLMQGKVELSDGRRRMTLAPGQAARLDKASHTLTATQADPYADGWRQGRLMYADITLAQLARAIERQYGVEVRIASAQVADTHISVMLQNNETVDELVSALRHVTGHEVSLRRGVVTIR